VLKEQAFGFSTYQSLHKLIKRFLLEKQTSGRLRPAASAVRKTVIPIPPLRQYTTASVWTPFLSDCWQLTD